MRVLANLPNLFFKEFDSIVKQFLWNDKRAKISKDILIRKRESGGLKLVDLATRQEAFKIQWIQLCQDNDFYSRFLMAKINTPLGQLIFECNFKPQHVNNIYPGAENDFWKQVLNAWAKYNFAMPENVDDVLEQIIWYNSLILVQGKLIFYHRAYQAGVLYIKDIVNDNGEFFTYAEFVSKYGGCIQWIEYWQILAGIHHEWKRILKEHHWGTNDVQRKYKVLMETNKWSRIVYDDLIDRDCENLLERKWLRWNKYLNIHIEFEHFCKNFKNISSTTIATKYRDFQYRLLHCIVFLNDVLYKWKLVDSPNCTFCKKKVETYVHFFWECPFVSRIWSVLRLYLKDNDQTGFCVELDFNANNIIFNRVHPKPSHVVNFLVLIVKQWIFSNRCALKTPRPEDLETNIEEVYLMEEFIAKQESKVYKHQIKWAALRAELQLEDNI